MTVTFLKNEFDEEVVSVVHFVGGTFEVLVDVDRNQAQVVGLLLHCYQY